MLEPTISSQQLKEQASMMEIQLLLLEPIVMTCRVGAFDNNSVLNLDEIPDTDGDGTPNFPGILIRTMMVSRIFLKTKDMFVIPIPTIKLIILEKILLA
jgi:hypothetical protein